MMTFSVPTYNKNSFTAKVAEITKKFKVSFELIWGDKKVIHEDTDKSGEKTVTYGYEVEVIIPEFHKFSDTGFLYLGCVKNETVTSIHPSSYAQDKGFSLSSLKNEIENFPCAECGKRIVRHIIHVFENKESGEISVYGSSCAIKKFGVDFSRLVARFESLYEIISGGCDDDGCFGGGGRYADHTNAEEWSRYAFDSIIRFGYVSGTKAYTEGGNATSADVNELYNIMHNSKITSEYAKKIRATLPARIEENKLDWDAFMTWNKEFVAGLEESDFSFNMKAVFDVMEDGILTMRMAGFAAYMIFKYWFEVIKVQDTKTPYNVDYSGMKVGDKVKGIKVTLVNEFKFDSMYGTTFIYTFRGIEDNRKYKWKTGNRIASGVTNFTFTSGSIKEFENHVKYGQSIAVTRVKVAEMEA